MMYIWAWQAPDLAPEWLISWRMMLAWLTPRPAPPYSCGINAASQPASVSARTNSSGYAFSRSSFCQYAGSKRRHSARTGSRISSNELARWIGRREVQTDAVRARDIAAWNAMLDHDDPFPKEGDPVPSGFHWTLFPPIARQSELGPDGHPPRGAFLPPVKLPRRMWAGSRIQFGAPLH